LNRSESFSRIQSVSFELHAPIEGLSQAVQHYNIESHFTHQEHLSKLLKGLCEKLPNIQRLTVFAWLTVPQIEQALFGPTSVRWLTAVQKIPVGKTFAISRFVDFDNHWQKHQGTESEEERNEKQMDWERKLTLHMMPDSFSVGTTNDLPEHLGLGWLFG
jgi:hypothetical protein